MSVGDYQPKMTVREQLAVIAFVAAAVGWGLSIKFSLTATQLEVASHTKAIAEQHDLLIGMASEQKAQARVLNYLANGWRGEPPIIANSNPSSP